MAPSILTIYSQFCVGLTKWMVNDMDSNKMKSSSLKRELKETKWRRIDQITICGGLIKYTAFETIFGPGWLAPGVDGAVACVDMNFCTPPNTISSPRPLTIEYRTASSGAPPLQPPPPSVAWSHRTRRSLIARLMSNTERLIVVVGDATGTVGVAVGLFRDPPSLASCLIHLYKSIEIKTPCPWI